ncbi:hypothetical protein OROMI_016236 [Orobanche minor]
MSSWALSRLTNLRKHLNPPSSIRKGESSIVKISQEVSEALSVGRAVVALESTIISHVDDDGDEDFVIARAIIYKDAEQLLQSPFHLGAKGYKRSDKTGGCVKESYLATAERLGLLCLDGLRVMEVMDTGHLSNYYVKFEILLLLVELFPLTTSSVFRQQHASEVCTAWKVPSTDDMIMPYPQNLETAKEVEAIVRQNGAVPATIGILDGIPCVGLSAEELERLAILGRKARKTARRDIAHVVATRGNGATTVSATMFFASMVGIQIFVTGGIGGVHRHGESTMDISSDLIELGRTHVAVVSAGVKSILDIPRTLEYLVTALYLQYNHLKLETHGVCVAAYRTNEFPAFFTDKSGCKAPCRVDSPEECARLIDTNINLNLGSGVLIAVPIPSEYSASGNIIESAIQRALKEAR